MSLTSNSSRLTVVSMLHSCLGPCRYVFIFFSVLTLLWKFPSGIFCTFPVPRVGNLKFCMDYICVSETVAQYQHTGAAFIGFLTYSFAEDSYLSLYLGSVQHLFYEDVPVDFVCVTIVLQCPERSSCFESGLVMMKIFPPKSILVANQHGVSRFGTGELVQLKLFGVNNPAVVLHLNHEQPWSVADELGGNSLSLAPESVGTLYTQFLLVLRNYYFKPLVKSWRDSDGENKQIELRGVDVQLKRIDNTGGAGGPAGGMGSAHYLPLSVPFEGYLIGSAAIASPLGNLSSVPASRRPLRCHFRGRLDYSYRSYYDEETGALKRSAAEQKQQEETATGRSGTGDSSNSSHGRGQWRSEQERERRAMALLAQEGRLGGCSVEEVAVEGVVEGGYQARYTSYMAAMARSAFALCPAGNNPETFRLHEVCTCPHPNP